MLPEGATYYDMACMIRAWLPPEGVRVKLVLHPCFGKMHDTSTMRASQHFTGVAKSNAVEAHREQFKPDWKATFPDFMATTHDRGTVTARPQT